MSFMMLYTENIIIYSSYHENEYKHLHIFHIITYNSDLKLLHKN